MDRQKEEAEKRKKMREVFDEIDTDKGGTLDQEEIGRMATVLGIPMSKGELEQAMIEMDEDGSGDVDFEEFAAWWPQLEGKNEALMNALQNKLEGIDVPVKFEDATMTLTIVPQDLIKGPGPRPSRGSATGSSTASSAGSRIMGGSRDFVFAWDPPDVDVSLRTGDKQGIYQSREERIAARRVMWSGRCPRTRTGTGGEHLRTLAGLSMRSCHTKSHSTKQTKLPKLLGKWQTRPCESWRSTAPKQPH